jgi:hypothetical protein
VRGIVPFDSSMSWPVGPKLSYASQGSRSVLNTYSLHPSSLLLDQNLRAEPRSLFVYKHYLCGPATEFPQYLISPKPSEGFGSLE